jgi:hypothetical protein
MTNFLIDGNRMLRDLRLPYYTIAMMRQMKVGDRLVTFDWCSQQSLIGNGPQHWGRSAIDRVRGGYLLIGGLMLEANQGTHLLDLMESGINLKLLPGRQFEMSPARGDSSDFSYWGRFKMLIQIYRTAETLSRMASKAGYPEEAWELMPTVSYYKDSKMLPNRPEFLTTLNYRSKLAKRKAGS